VSVARLFSIPAAAPEPASLPRAVLPEAPRRIRIGMPHLDAGGLSENWLLRDAGDRHWEAIGQRLGVPTDQIRSESGERLYPTVVAVRARYDAPLAAVHENDVFQASAEVVPCGRACAHGRVVATVGKAGGATTRVSLELLTTFAARASAGARLRMALPEPTLARRWVSVGDEPPIAALARAARRGGPLADAFAGPVMALADHPLGELTYEPSPYADYNGAGLLYFASYVTIADSAERQLVRRLGLALDRGPSAVAASAPASGGARAVDWALATSAVRRDVFFYDNLPLGDALTATLMSFHSEGDRQGNGNDREVTTRIRLSRQDDEAGGARRPMADVITRRRFVPGAGERR
jgi:probable biosynthetic protein (TIGR04098 family)